jgi:hypothetical protein
MGLYDFFIEMICIKDTNIYLCITLKRSGDVAQLVEHRTENP